MLVLTLVALMSAKGQTISGCIVNHDNQESIPFALIEFPELNKIIRADINGCFTLEQEISLVQRISIKAPGFEHYSEDVKLTDAMRFELHPMHLDLNEVVVTGHRSDLQRNVVTHVDKVSLKDLNAIPATSNAQILEQISGVYGANLGGGITKPVIRGLQGNRVVTLLNGARLENQQWGRDHGSALTDLGVASVEVIKGPSSLMYGADALGGILQYTDESYLPVGEKKLTVSTFAESNALLYGARSQFAFAKEKFKLNIGGSYLRTSDYTITSGMYVNNSRYLNWAFKGSLGWSGKKHSNNLRFAVVSGRYGIPGHTHDTIITTETFLRTNRDYRKIVPVQYNSMILLQWQNKLHFERSTLSSSIAFSGNQLEEYEGKITIPELGLVTLNAQPSIIYDFRLTEKIRWMNGVQAMYLVQQNDTNAEDELVPNASQLDAGLFSIFNMDWKKWRFQIGARVDSRTLDSDKGGFDFFAWNYSLGGVRNGDHNSLHINFSSGVRMPTLAELTSFGVHHGTMRFEIGNQNLEPEYGRQLDVAYDLGNDHFHIILNPFISSISNFIQVSPTDSLEEGVPVFHYKSYTSALMYGGEIGFHYHPHFLHELHFEPSFSYVEGEINTNEMLPLMPQGRLKTDIKWEFKKRKGFFLDNITAQYFYYLRQNRVGINETTTADYGLLNLSVKCVFGKNERGAIQLAVRNVTNTKFISHLSSLKFLGIQDPGRNFVLKFNYQIL